MTSDTWNPQQYEKFKKERSQPFYDLMNLLQPQAQARIVDLGCGTGELTADLHRHMSAEHTLGLDSSSEMLKKANALQVPNLEFQTADINQWAPQKSFDIIFSNAALQWCENHGELFLRLKNALRPNGQLAVQMPMNHDFPTHVLASTMAHEKPWVDLLETGGYEKQRTTLSPEGYAKLLFDLGFKEQTVLLKVYVHIMESREGAIEWVKGTLLTRFKSQLSEENYQKFLKEYRERLFAQLPDQKPFFYPFKRVLIWGRL